MSGMRYRTTTLSVGCDEMSLARLRSDLNTLAGARDLLKTKKEALQQEVASLEAEEILLDRVSDVFRDLIDQEIMEGVSSIESLLGEGMQAVFNDQDLSVQTNLDVKRGKVSLDLLTTHKRSDGLIVQGSVEDSFGGSVAALQSLLMRVVVVLGRDLRKVFFLDESLPAFNDHYVSLLGTFLSLLCERLGMDILLVTHKRELLEVATNSHRMRRKAGKIGIEPARVT